MSQWRRFAFAMLLLAAAAAPARAQIVRGVLIDDATAAPIDLGAVTLLQDGRVVIRSTVTGADGRFIVRLRSAGTYQIRAERIGYRTSLSVPLHLRDADTIHVELRMSTTAIVLAPLTVTAATRMPIAEQTLAAFHERARRGFGQFLGPEEVSRRLAFQASDLLRDMQGIRVIPGRVDQPGNMIRMNGAFGSCTPVIYVDGFEARGMGLDEVVSGGMVRAVEVYRRSSQVPVQFSSPSNFNCGAVLVWTRMTIPDSGG